MPELHFVNLSNGLEWLSELPLQLTRYCRVESTAIERDDWPRVLGGLGPELLMALATGVTCHFYDCGCRRPVSKTVSVGVPRIRGILEAVWLRDDAWPRPARTDAERHVKRQLRYFRRYLDTPEIRLVGHSRRTDRDADRPFHRALVLGAPAPPGDQPR